MDTLLIVGGVTLALFAAWVAARRVKNRLNAELAAFALYDPNCDFNDGWEWYDYSPQPEPEGLIVEVFDEAAYGPRR